MTVPSFYHQICLELIYEHVSWLSVVSWKPVDESFTELCVSGFPSQPQSTDGDGAQMGERGSSPNQAKPNHWFQWGSSEE